MSKTATERKLSAQSYTPVMLRFNDQETWLFTRYDKVFNISTPWVLNEYLYTNISSHYLHSVSHEFNIQNPLRHINIYANDFFNQHVATCNTVPSLQVCRIFYA